MRIGDWSSDVCSSDLRVLRSRRFGHRDAVFLYGRLETREDTARLLGRIAHALGDPLTQCDAPLLSKGARGVFAGEVARHILGPLTRQGANELALILRSEEHTSELQSLMRITYAVF